MRAHPQRLDRPLRPGPLEDLVDLDLADLADLRVPLLSPEAGICLLPWHLLGRLRDCEARLCSGERLRVPLLPRCLGRLLRAADGDALQVLDALRLVDLREPL